MDNDKLLTSLGRPALYERSAEKFWDDSHISEAMLAAHLDPDLDAASRKLATIERSTEWLKTVIPSDASILDLGCGPGLYDVRLARAGYKVTGVDLSERSLDYARSKDALTSYVCQNYLNMSYENEFDAAILIYCDYAALTRDERKQLLKQVRAALKPNGLFILDVFTDAAFEKKSEQKSWSAHAHGGFWSDESYVCLEATYLYENGTVCADKYVVLTKDGEKEYIVWNTAFTLDRLTCELESGGFTVISSFGGVCGEPYGALSETLCVVAK